MHFGSQARDQKPQVSLYDARCVLYICYMMEDILCLYFSPQSHKRGGGGVGFRPRVIFFFLRLTLMYVDMKYIIYINYLSFYTDNFVN